MASTAGCVVHTSLPCAHRALVWSMKFFTCAVMFP